MCKTQTGRGRKLGKWIRRIDQTGTIGPSARRREESGGDEWKARTSWAENSRCSTEKWKDWWMWRERNGWRKGGWMETEVIDWGWWWRRKERREIGKTLGNVALLYWSHIDVLLLAIWLISFSIYLSLNNNMWAGSTDTDDAFREQDLYWIWVFDKMAAGFSC